MHKSAGSLVVVVVVGGGGGCYSSLAPSPFYSRKYGQIY